MSSTFTHPLQASAARDKGAARIGGAGGAAKGGGRDYDGERL